MWTSKIELEARELSRRNIQEVRDIVILDHAKLDKHCKSYDAHVLKGEDTVDKIFKKIDEQECPKEETIEVLERYKKEQNGCLKELKKQALEQRDTLNALVNQNKGVDKAKENRNRKLTLWISIIGAVLVFSALFFQIWDMKKSALKSNAILEYKMEHLEGKN